MPLQSYEDVLSLLSGDVPAVIWKEARDEAAEFASLLADLQNEGVKVNSEVGKKIVDRVSQYLNPPPGGASGDFVVNSQKAAVKWNWQTGRFQNTFPITLSAGQQVDATVATQAMGGMRGDSEISALMLKSTGRVSVLMTIPFLNRKLSNVPVSSNLMFGNAQLPALLAQTLLTLPTAAWSIALKDLSNATNSASPVYYGRRFTDRHQDRLDQVRRALLFSQFMHPYVLGPTAGVVSGGGGLNGGPEVVITGGQTATLRFDTGGADFDWRWILDDSTSSDGLEPNLTANILLGDSGLPLADQAISWRDFMAAPTVAVTGMMPIGGISGIAAASMGSPGCWSMLVRRGTKLQVQFTNNNASNGASITLRPGLGGIALYAPTDLQRLLHRQAGAIQEGR